ncbi:MAG: N-acetylglucosaminyldiphosphoundecaprenol N-acetyl-beta-D-mannosaminyltransferase [Colwellia polaris]|jgi:N-acetylglucosaminyldiphosphoundecaprenol N-acetyl-beta-D-mannosaminyltransferase|tara:strand:- start:3744 stop:4478 length:735 start_codon:yes stop_codon:yes gene_type:complete
MYKEVIKKVIDAPEINELLQSALRNSDEPPTLISFVNPYSYMVLRDNRQVANQVDIYFSDALVSSSLFSSFAMKKVPRVSFDYGSFAKTFFEKVCETEHAVYFVGSKLEQVSDAVASFQKVYPRLKVAGYRHGYFVDDNEKAQVAEEIANSGAAFVVCGMGTPYQENFGALLKGAKGSIKQIYTCGGFLHQSSEALEYYPSWINRLNLRWLYRAIKEDYVMNRLLVQYPQFLFLAFYDFLKRSL